MADGPTRASDPAAGGPGQPAGQEVLGNEAYLGGLRSPWKAAQQVPGLRETGQLIREVFEEFLDGQPDEWPEKLLNTRLGESLDQTLSEELAQRLARKLGCSAAKGLSGCLRPHIARVLTELSGDPDVSVPDWLLRGAPIGVSQPIPHHGVFPPVDPKEERPEAEAFWTKQATDCFYRSLEEEAGWVNEKLHEMTEAGYLTEFPSLAAAQAVHGEVVVNKMACLVKVLASGDLKRRLIVDMLRSGANDLAQVTERIVLPRILDLSACLRRLLSLCAGDGFVDQLVLDFVDAFYSVGVHEDEARYQFVQGPDGRLYRFDVLAMGGAAAPLIWGRVAAWVMRQSSAIYPSDELRIQCFVDDPWMAARGARARRRRMLAVVVLFWMALGLRLSWAKKQFGPEITWIGVQTSASLEEIVFTVPAKFLDKLKTDLQGFLAAHAIPLKAMRSFAGGLSWVAGVFRWLRAFLSPLWAAIASAAGWQGPPGTATIGASQVRHALLWVQAFLEGHEGALARRIGVAPRTATSVTQIVCDASPWGLGAILTVNDVPVSWLADAITDLDLDILGKARGDCRGQAVFEALCIAVSLRTWAAVWRDENSILVTRSDAIAALGALNKTSSSDPTMNRVAREVALDLSEGSYELDVLGHPPAQWNTATDALSRLFAPAPDRLDIPEFLLDTPRAQPAERTAAWWRTAAAPRG